MGIWGLRCEGMGCGLDGREGPIGRERGWTDARVLLLGRLAMSRVKGAWLSSMRVWKYV